MDELTGKVADNLNIDHDKAERSVGIMLSLVKSHGDQNKVGELFDKIPGASELAAQYGSEEGRSGGLFGMLGGGLMGAPLAALAKLQSNGLDMPQIKLLGKTVLGHAKEHAGEDLVREVTASIPGLNSYL